MRRNSRGFTVIELLIAVTVIAIVLALALPSYRDVINRRAVTNAAEQVAVFIGLARTESVRRNRAITVEFDNTQSEFCVGMWDATNCDCLVTDTASPSYCEITQGGQDTHLVLRGSSYENLQTPVLTAEGSGDTALFLTFDPVRGILNTVNDDSGTVLITSENDRFALRVNVGLTGRVDICSPSAKAVPGYPSC